MHENSDNLYTKVQEFKNEIRRQHLHSYFKKIRKQFITLSSQQSSTQHLTNELNKIIQQSTKRHNQHFTNTINKIQIQQQQHSNHKEQTKSFSTQELHQIASLASTEYGIQVILKTQIPISLLAYLFPKYYNTQQQHYVTCIYANITFIRPEKIPTHQFLKFFMNILLHSMNVEDMTDSISSNQIIENCLLIIYNLIVEYDQILEYYLDDNNDTNFINLLYGILETTNSKIVIQKAFKILNSIQKYHKSQNLSLAKHKHKNITNKSFRRFLKFYISIFQNVQEITLIFLSLSNIKQLLYMHSKQGFLTAQDIREDQTIRNYAYSMDMKVVRNQLIKNDFNIDELTAIQRQIQKSKLLNKILAIYPVIKNDRLILNQILLLLYCLLSGLDRLTLQQKILKLMHKIYIDNFYSNTSNNNNMKYKFTKYEKLTLLKQRFYQLIYHMLITFHTDHDIFTNSELYLKMSLTLQNLFEIQSDKQIQKAYIYIVGLLVFSGHAEVKIQQQVIQLVDKILIKQYFNLDQRFIQFIYNLKEYTQGLQNIEKK